LANLHLTRRVKEEPNCTTYRHTCSNFTPDYLPKNTNEHVVSFSSLVD